MMMYFWMKIIKKVTTIIHEQPLFYVDFFNTNLHADGAFHQLENID